MLKNELSSPQRKMLQLSLKKEGAGTPTLAGSCANFCTVTDNGVGDYTINFVDFPFAQLPEVVATPTTDNVICKIGTVAITSVQVLTEDLTGAAAEGNFHVFINGSLARDLIG
jgi:hypothetical protein